MRTDRRFSRSILFLVLASTLFYLTQLGNPLGGGHSDEPLYIGIATDMLKRHAWLVPFFHGQPAFYKPPLLYWMIIVSFKIFGGPSLFAARFPEALSGVALAGVAALLGKEMFGEKEGILAGWITATAIPGVYAFSRASLMDIPLTLSLAASFYFAYRACKEAQPAFLIPSLALAGISTLFKGPVSILIWLLPFVWLLISTHSFGLLKGKSFVLGMLAAAAAGLAWPIGLAQAGYGKAWLEFFIVRENFGKFATALDPTTHPISGSVIGIHLLSQLLPWTFFFLAAALFALRKEGRGNARLFLFTWIFTVVFIFLLPEKKLSHYTLPALPATAILAADVALNPAATFLSGMASHVTGLLFGVTGLLLFLLARVTGDPRDTLTVLLAGGCFLVGSFFLLRQKVQAAAYCAGGFLFLYALGLPHIMSPLDTGAFKRVAGERPVYAYDFDASILGKGIGKPIKGIRKPLHPTLQPGDLLILPDEDRVDLIRNGIRFSSPLLAWSQWKDHIRLLDILQAVLSGDARVIHEKIVMVKIT